MELHRFFRYAIEKMCKEKKSLNHFGIRFKVNEDWESGKIPFFYVYFLCLFLDKRTEEHIELKVKS